MSCACQNSAVEGSLCEHLSPLSQLGITVSGTTDAFLLLLLFSVVTGVNGLIMLSMESRSVDIFPYPCQVAWWWAGLQMSPGLHLTSVAFPQSWDAMMVSLSLTSAQQSEVPAQGKSGQEQFKIGDL